MKGEPHILLVSFGSASLNKCTSSFHSTVAGNQGQLLESSGGSSELLPSCDWPDWTAMKEAGDP